MQAKAGREHILGEMMKTLDKPRADLKPHVPRIEQMTIPKEFIGAVIGPGGKIIQGMQEETGATIEVHEDGNVFIASTDQGGEQAKKMIEDIVKVPEVGEEYEGEVVNIQSFGAFVKLTPNKDGLLHISRVANGRVGKVEDVLSEGDIVKVKIIDVDEKTGKISLDRLDKPDAPASSEAPKKERDNRPGRAGRRERSAQSHDNRRPRRRNHSNEE